MDITNQAEVILRKAGYDTWQWSGGRVPVTCFENLSLLGFLHVFPSAQALVSEWEGAQNVALSRFAPMIKLSGEKAWNVYSVLLTEDVAPALEKHVERIEENFSLTRKIARSGIRSPADLVQALLSLLPISSQPLLEQADFAERLQSRLGNVPQAVITAFLGTGLARDIAEMLRDSQ